MTELARSTMPFLYALSAFRTPWLSGIMSLLTHFGDAALFVVVGLLLYWCWDKKKARYVLAVGLAGTVIGNCLKNVFRVPRPWLLDENFSIVESARARATGYSFPSGHTQVGVGLYGSLALMLKNRWAKLATLAMAVVIPFSRMILGVHTPLDTGFAALVSVVLIFALRPCMKTEKGMAVTLAALGAAGILMLTWTALLPAGETSEQDVTNLREGLKAACMSAAALAAMFAAYEADERFLHFETAGSLKTQLAKSALGLACTGILFGLVHFIPETSLVLRFAGYFVTVCFATIVWPMTFPWFRKRLG